MADPLNPATESPRAVAQRVARALAQTLATTHQASVPSATDDPPGSAQATAYVAMLPFAYTNSDVAQLCSQFGKVARVTVLRDRQTRKSRGVAFVQFARAEDCAAAVAELDGAALEGFALRCSLVRDNGRAHEFQRRRKYTADGPSRCFECGEYGHFSYSCPRNVLGARERPAPASKKKLCKKKKKGYDVQERGHYFNDEGVVNMLAPAADGEDDVSLTLLSYPSLPQELSAHDTGISSTHGKSRKRKAVGTYFSDESASDDDDDDR